MTIHVFAGPTLGHNEIQRRISGALVHGPVKLGDLLRLRPSARDIVLIIDGLFHQEPPIRHKEILDAMANGVTVIGASSMGALRAAELHQYGMIGIGSVFEMYRDGIIDADDEVAVTHSLPPDWRLFSEALVNVRYAVRLCADKSIISAEHTERIVALAQGLPYQLRKWPAIEAEAAYLDAQLHASVVAIRGFLAANPGIGDLKRRDALRAIDVVNRGTFTSTAGAEQDWRTAGEWRTMHLARWVAEFRGLSTSALPGSGLALFNYQQIYDVDFPRRWERYILRRIASSGTATPPAHLSLRNRALTVATRAELGLELLAEDRKSEWLTPTELASCDDDELIVRVLVRSSSKSPDFTRTPFDEDGLLVNLPATELAVAEAFAINRKVAEVASGKQISNLKDARLKKHLCEVWEAPLDADERYLTAAARDRGFISVDEAVLATRPFFLRNSTHAARLADKMLVRTEKSIDHA